MESGSNSSGSRNSSGSHNSYRNTSRLVSNETQPPMPRVMAANQGIKIDNPFSLKVGQVFTGFGVGCGVGIGVGTPINFGAFPMVGEIMSAARGAIGPLSGVTMHVNNTLRKMGAKNIQAGVGCGVGFGHGFGVGLAVKPAVLQKMQACCVEVMTKMMVKLGIVPDSSKGQDVLPLSPQSSHEPSIQNPFENITKLTTIPPVRSPPQMHESTGLDPYATYGNSASKSNLVDSSFSSRTEKVLSSFLQNQFLNEDDTNLNVVNGRLQSEKQMLQMVLKHQQIIEELMEENKKLREILVDDLKISPNKFQKGYSPGDKFPCTECFECRRKLRKR